MQSELRGRWGECKRWLCENSVSLRLGHGIPGTGHPPDTRVSQLWKENKAEQEVRDPAHSSHFTHERHQNRRGLWMYKEVRNSIMKGADLRFLPFPDSCFLAAQAVTATGSSTVQRCSFTLGVNVLISLLSSWPKIERRAARRENRVLILPSHSRDPSEDP